ncbi:MAG: helix-turn-helix transcriptional regulator [bacterium]|nr:helix-turn-helix transcriptional regulator [bacterium]
MITVERQLDRVLTLLRNMIRERGFTQLEVQEALGWGRSYISQLLTKQKSLRIEQVLLILNVIGVDPSEFFGELYHFPRKPAGFKGGGGYRYATGSEISEGSGAAAPPEELRHDFGELRALLRGLVRLLTDKGLLEREELQDAAQASRSGSLVPDG